MVKKLEDSLQDEKERRSQRNKARSRLEHLLRSKKSTYKRIINRLKEEMNHERVDLKRQHKHKTRMIKINRKEEKKYHLPVILKRYEKAEVFNDELKEKFVPGAVKGPVIVGGDENLLSKEEVAILIRGPKYTIRRILDKERFQLEMEKVFVKLRWALRDKDVMDDVELESLMTDEEKKRISELVELEEIKTRSVFDHDKNEVDFRNSRATDVKHNSKVILP